MASNDMITDHTLCDMIDDFLDPYILVLIHRLCT
jgi:hypothetical protein